MFAGAFSLGLGRGLAADVADVAGTAGTVGTVGTVGIAGEIGAADTAGGAVAGGVAFFPLFSVTTLRAVKKQSTHVFSLLRGRKFIGRDCLGDAADKNQSLDLYFSRIKNPFLVVSSNSKSYMDRSGSATDIISFGG